MAAALELGPLYFVILKIILVSAGVFYLWRNQRNAFARFGIYAMAAVYISVCLYHFAGTML